jgi:hypothetical protein
MVSSSFLYSKGISVYTPDVKLRGAVMSGISMDYYNKKADSDAPESAFSCY